MKKIKTIFERDWDGNREIIPEYVENGVFVHKLETATATEKLDGTNIRVTVRNNTVVRVEKRRNPNKIQKQSGIKEPWYTDASDSSEDKWIMDAVKNTDFNEIPDGEWSGEAIGKNIQGNPLNLENNRVVFFTLNQAPIFRNVPNSFCDLARWIKVQKSKIGNNCGIEGIVWHLKDGRMYKIKTKDFEGVELKEEYECYQESDFIC